MGAEDEGTERPGREPIINAPWPAVAVVLAILGSYAWQAWFAGGDAAIGALGFAPADLDRGRWQGLITVMFAHGGWTHAIMNALGALAFGPPVARLMGSSPRGALAFFAFYLVCGVLSTLGYAVMHLHAVEPVVGASGAVSGLMGAAARLFDRGDQLAPVTSRAVLSVGLGWIVANALLAVFGAAPLTGGGRIAWEAHIAGFVLGVLLVGPFARLAGPPAQVIAPM